MPRPVVDRKVVVSATPAPESHAPQLGVYAPLDVRAPQTSAFDGLARALGVVGQAGGTAMAQRADATAKADAAEGQADAELAQVDPERAAHSRAYADAAHNTNIIKQYQDAEAAVTEWAATNLDASKPFTEQTAALDAEMKRRLGALAQDPRAKAIIAPRYQKFIEGAANGILSKQVQARANEALDTAKGDIATDLAAGGDGRYAEQVQRLAPLLGDRTKAVQAVVGMYIDHAQDVAAKGGDWQHVFNSLPSDITLPDGSKIPGPGRSPALHDALTRGRAQAQQAFNEWAQPQHDVAQAQLFVDLQARAHRGEAITLEALKPYLVPGADGTPPKLTPSQAAGFVETAARQREAIAAQNSARNALQIVPNWQTMIGQVDPADPKGKRVLTREHFQKAFDVMAAQASQGFQNPDAALALSAQYNLPSTAIHEMLSTVANPASVKAAVAQLPLYEKVKAQGLQTMYLSDEQVAYFEYLTAQHQHGATVDDIVQAGARYRPAEAKAIAAEGMKDAMDKLLSTTEPNTGIWGSNVRGTKFGDYLNQPMVKAAARKQLNALMVANGGNVDAAVAGVREMFGQQWMPVQLNGHDALIPRRGRRADGSAVTYDPAVMNAMLSQLSAVHAPEAAKKAGAANYKEARFRIVAMPGGDAEVEVTDDVGNPIPGTNTVPLPQVYEIAEREYRAQAYKAAAGAKADAELLRSGKLHGQYNTNGGALTGRPDGG